MVVLIIAMIQSPLVNGMGFLLFLAGILIYWVGNWCKTKSGVNAAMGRLSLKIFFKWLQASHKHHKSPISQNFRLKIIEKERLWWIKKCGAKIFSSCYFRWIHQCCAATFSRCSWRKELEQSILIIVEKEEHILLVLDKCSFASFYPLLKYSNCTYRVYTNFCIKSIYKCIKR